MDRGSWLGSCDTFAYCLLGTLGYFSHRVSLFDINLVCGVLHEHHTDQETDEDDEIHLYPIAGNYEMHNSRGLDPQSTRLKDSQSNSDKDKEGVRIALHGGKLPFDGKSGTPQMAIFEFICDKERTGREEFDEKAGEVRVRAEDDGDDKEGDEKGDDKDKDKSLKLISYGNEKQDGKDVGVLRLEWRTKYACETQDDDDTGDDGEPAKKGTHWGFFTWFIIMSVLLSLPLKCLLLTHGNSLFLAVAAYLIFGSWLNYNRYGARGWDLLPHGDTIRDIPYLLKDWARRVLSTVQGGGSRGGYSAV